MDISGDLIWLVLRWAATIGAFISLFFIVMSLLDREDAGLIGIQVQKIFSPDGLIVLTEFATLVFLFSYGFYGLVWYLPEWVPEYEEVTRGGAALTGGFAAACFIFELGKRINAQHRNQIGKDEALKDIQKNFWRLVRTDGKAAEVLESMIEEIEGSVRPSDSRVEYRAREVRIAYLSELIRALPRSRSDQPSANVGD